VSRSIKKKDTSARVSGQAAYPSSLRGDARNRTASGNNVANPNQTHAKPKGLAQNILTLPIAFLFSKFSKKSQRWPETASIADLTSYRGANGEQVRKYLSASQHKWQSCLLSYLLGPCEGPELRLWLAVDRTLPSAKPYRQYEDPESRRELTPCNALSTLPNF
jgi:hypothetical protein